MWKDRAWRKLPWTGALAAMVVMTGLVLLSCTKTHQGPAVAEGGAAPPQEVDAAQDAEQDRAHGPYAEERERMIAGLLRQGVLKTEPVIKAMRHTPRHEFVPRSLWRQAYHDRPLPIGEDQTISAPHMVALMTELLEPDPEHVVLEIGTGSGYQAAVLAPLVKHVYTIEIVESLARRSARTLERLKYENVTVRHGDGYKGWAEHAPFDGIMVTCAPENVPEPLVEQLREGGRMVIPVGPMWEQELYVMRKVEGELERTAVVPVMFVPMTGEAQEGR